MKANRGLGRGLDALMPEIPQEDARERVMMLRMGDIDPNPEQPRRKFDAQALAELAASIRQVGVPANAAGARRAWPSWRRFPPSFVRWTKSNGWKRR